MSLDSGPSLRRSRGRGWTSRWKFASPLGAPGRSRRGRWTTSDRGKTVGLSLGSGTPQYFLLRLRSRPTRGDMEWSPWLTDPYSGKKTPVPPGETVEIRYRVRLHAEPAASPGGPASPRSSPP